MNCYFLKSVRKKYKEYQIRTESFPEKQSDPVSSLVAVFVSSTGVLRDERNTAGRKTTWNAAGDRKTFLNCKFDQCFYFNPFGPKGDQHQISPCNINAL